MIKTAMLIKMEDLMSYVGWAFAVSRRRDVAVAEPVDAYVQRWEKFVACRAGVVVDSTITKRCEDELTAVFDVALWGSWRTPAEVVMYREDIARALAVHSDQVLVRKGSGDARRPCVELTVIKHHPSELDPAKTVYRLDFAGGAPVTPKSRLPRGVVAEYALCEVGEWLADGDMCLYDVPRRTCWRHTTLPGADHGMVGRGIAVW